MNTRKHSSVTTQALKKENQEDTLRTILDSLSDAVIATDNEGKILLVNPSAELLLDCESLETIGQPIDDICHFIDRHSREHITNPIFDAIQQQDTMHIDDNALLLSQQDNVRFVSGNAAPIFNDQHTLSGAVLVMRDISDQTTLEQQLRHADKMQSIGELTGGIAHDFNNMLGAIMGAAQVLDTLGNDQNEKRQDYIDLIMRVSENAAELIRNLLAFSRKSATEESVLPINDILHQTTEIARHALRKNITISFDASKHDLSCMGDQTAIQSMILNLCINAQDAMPDGGTLNIACSKTFLKTEDWQVNFPHIKNAHYVLIEVTDSGHGMDESLLQRIFEPFFTTKERGKGTGLGLSAVYGTINSHLGCISVHSQKGAGTTFKLYLPIHIGDDEPMSSASLKVMTSQTPHVLLIDDDENLRPIMKTLIESIGYPVLPAANGPEGIALFQKFQQNIGVVLLDLVMEEMSGRQAFDLLKEQDAEVKVILISGYDRGADSEYLLSHGAKAYLRKPFSMHALTALFDEHIENKK